MQGSRASATAPCPSGKPAWAEQPSPFTDCSFLTDKRAGKSHSWAGCSKLAHFLALRENSPLSAVAKTTLESCLFFFFHSRNKTDNKAWIHRMVEVGKDLWKSPCPQPVPKQEPIAQHRVQTAVEYLQGWRLHSLPEHPVPMLSRPHSKKCFLGEPSMCPFVPIATCPVTGHLWKGPGSVLSAPSLWVFHTRMSFPLDHSLVQAELSQLSQPFLTGEKLQSLGHLGGPLLGSP